MLNDFWETAPSAYKYAVFGGMGLTALGIIIIVIGAATSTPGLTFVGLPVIGVGLIAHMTSLMLRGRAVRKALKEAELRDQGRKPRR
ncbi:DUF3188 domain-containing protein [Arthrobacter livingstonensis]|uniref:DUF3188 domain-containing protein n=1 Tax=Arthrobacter livingstonensis TaxID=670078 RepID=A0A2V5L7E4_9MICC|nr:DUF3188 domain-containing protein [Arthrobacter livingstonensis]PYI67319.1 DUF3188 domain-containing protein [Arthrobacter livingstonensis]